MENFMKQNFQKIRMKDCSVFFRGPRANRTMTQTGYIEVSNTDVRNKLIDQFESRSLKCVIDGRTMNAGKRNATLKQAMDVLKKDSRTVGKNVKIEWSSMRGFTVDGVYAFTQSATDFVNFDPLFTDISLQ